MPPNKPSSTSSSFSLEITIFDDSNGSSSFAKRKGVTGTGGLFMTENLAQTSVVVTLPIEELAFDSSEGLVGFTAL